MLSTLKIQNSNFQNLQFKFLRLRIWSNADTKELLSSMYIQETDAEFPNCLYLNYDELTSTDNYFKIGSGRCRRELVGYAPLLHYEYSCVICHFE